MSTRLAGPSEAASCLVGREAGRQRSSGLALTTAALVFVPATELTKSPQTELRQHQMPRNASEWNSVLAVGATPTVHEPTMTSADALVGSALVGWRYRVPSKSAVGLKNWRVVCRGPVEQTLVARRSKRWRKGTKGGRRVAWGGSVGCKCG